MAYTPYWPEMFNIAIDTNMAHAWGRVNMCLHALTGCDTTSKIATKLAALNAIHIPTNLALLSNFNCPQLTDN
jgi:hypothetical protein